MKKLSLMRYVLIAAIFSAVFFAWSCGGGGGGGGGGQTPAAQPLTPASMDQTTAETVTAMAMSSGYITDISDQFVDAINERASGADIQPSRSLGAWALARVREGFLAGKIIDEQNESRAGSSSFPEEDCEDSGTWQLSGTWTGPDEPTDICQVSNATVTMIHSHCQEYGENIDGTVIVQISGNMCAPTGISLAFNDFSMTDSHSALQINSSDFDIAMTALQWSGDVMTHAKITFNGDIAVDEFDMEFSQYSQEASISGSNQTITISGSMTGGCLDGWVTFTTLSPVHDDDYSDCPVGGSVRISGSTDMVVTFNSDGSLTIGDQEYASCYDLPEVCQ